VRHGLHRRVETIRAATFPFKPFRSPCLRPCTPVVAHVSRRVNLFVTAPGVPTRELLSHLLASWDVPIWWSEDGPLQQPRTGIESAGKPIRLRVCALVSRRMLHYQWLMTLTSCCHSGSHPPPSLNTTPIYDFGVRLGHAPQIDEDSLIGRDSGLKQL
jgi:hypothetical protein